jgi:hypothetical protein
MPRDFDELFAELTGGAPWPWQLLPSNRASWMNL